jgi:hypothetical protein
VAGAIQNILLVVLVLTEVAATVVFVLMRKTEEGIRASAKIAQLYVTVSMSVNETSEGRADGHGS